MARAFDVPLFYRSPIISRVKDARKILDPRKKDFTPSILNFGPVQFKIARHFGFCYGVEQAIEIAYRALEENPDKRIFLLSEMIHNPHVNDDLQKRGIRFLRSTSGEQLIPMDELEPEDVLLIPAFGASLEVEEEIRARGVDTRTYNTTCPFVEKVWKRSRQIGAQDYTIIVHGKRFHEETRATYSHAKKEAPVVVVRDLEEAKILAQFIRGELPAHQFFEHFEDRYTDGFNPDEDLKRIGVVNQTTMLATETQAIAALLKQAIVARYGEEDISGHFADTSDTLCYATNENQQATKALIETGADLAIIVGGFNSSNTSHLVELCEEAMPAYFIDSAERITPLSIEHFDLHEHRLVKTDNWLPDRRPVEVILTAGASCPDALLDEVIQKITAWMPGASDIETVLAAFGST